MLPGRAQNVKRTPTCICRADVVVLRIWPNDASGAVSVPVPLKATSDGGPKLTRLNRLKISSPQLHGGGPAQRAPRHRLGQRHVRRPQVGSDQIVAAHVPSRPAGCSTNAVGSNQASGSPVTASSGPRPGA